MFAVSAWPHYTPNSLAQVQDFWHDYDAVWYQASLSRPYLSGIPGLVFKLLRLPRSDCGVVGVFDRRLQNPTEADLSIACRLRFCFATGCVTSGPDIGAPRSGMEHSSRAQCFRP